MWKNYFHKVREKMEQVEATEQESIVRAAGKVAECIKGGGIVHLFGCGHSHILTEEVFYRAGGLVPISPILIEPLMLHEGPVRSSMLERQAGYAEEFMKDQDIRDGDVMFVISTSGRNSVPIDVCHVARDKGAYVIAITSLEYSQSQPSRHPSGKYLFNSAHLTINNHSNVGDALLTHPKVLVPFSPSSTVVGAAILNAVFAESIKIMADSGYEAPIFMSGNVDGADEHNQRMIDKYSIRIPLLGGQE